MMSGIRSQNTTPERLVRAGLHAAGFRFRCDSRIGRVRPDVVLPRWNAAIFVHGCFWHRHPGCNLAYHPKSRQRFWAEKFRQNLERDARQYALLQEAGWRVLVMWECVLRKESTSREAIKAAADWIRSESSYGEIPPRAHQGSAESAVRAQAAPRRKCAS
jgi:DNA mismatch endonuclease (patch repair protein)